MSSTAQALPQRELVLDRYRPLRPLGRGGSGSVWLARDERTGLDVALKIVPREGKRAPRAEREAEAAARLRHERCVRAYDFGGDDGHVYIAYEYVPGRTLRDALRQGHVSDRQAIEAATQVLDGLGHAHARGIVHRDVKPSNVLLEDGEAVSVKLLDFGLAQFEEADTLTAVGDVPGTLAYISPERLHGQDASAESDVWSVGVMLWEALAGHHPFLGVPLPEVAGTIARGVPPLQGQRPDLPKRLLRVIASALDIQPSKRPPASVLAAELREALAAPRHERRTRQSTARLGRLRRLRPPRSLAFPARPAALEARALSAGLAGLTTVVGGSLLPFWPPGVLAVLALAAAVTSWWAPRLGLALALFAPVFPFGNDAKGAALLYAAAAASLLALGWRDARAGLAFVVGPLLAPIGGLALLPLAVQPVRGWFRRGVHASLAVLAAALLAGLRGDPLPFAGTRVGDLGLGTTEHPTIVLQALWTTLAAHPEIATTAIALGIAAALLPYARSRGRWGIACLTAGQLAVILLSEPSIPPTSIVLGTWLLCGALWPRTSR